MTVGVASRDSFQPKDQPSVTIGVASRDSSQSKDEPYEPPSLTIGEESEDEDEQVASLSVRAERVGSDDEAVPTKQAALAAVQQGKVPYNSVNLVAMGPGGAGKTATRRSIMGLEFSDVRESTVGGEQEHLLISLKLGDMVGFKSIQDVKQLERALLHYLHHSQKADANVEKARKLLDLVQNNAGADEASPLSYLVTVVMLTCYWLRWPGYATSWWRTSSAW